MEGTKKFTASGENALKVNELKRLRGKYLRHLIKDVFLLNTIFLI